MQIIKSGLIRKVGILALALIIVVFGTSVIDKNFHFFSKISQLPGQVAGVIIVNDPGKFLPTVNLVGAQASAPYQDVQGDVAISGKVSVGNTIDNVGVTGITLGLGRSEIEFIASNYGDYGYGHKFYSSDPADGSGIVQLRLAARQNTTTWKDMVVFASDGRVAIGQDWLPGAPLQVTGTSNEFTGSRNAIAMYNPNPSNSSSEILFMGKGAVRGWEVGNDILANGGNNFYIADATVGKGRLFIDEYGNSRFSGHLRLGDTSGSTQTAGPGNTLYFSGGPFASDNTDPISIGRYDAASNDSELRVNIGDDGNDRFVIGKYWYIDGLWHPGWTVTADGIITIGSSRELKKDIRYLTENDYQKILDKVNNINMVNFLYKTEENKKPHLGVISEEAPDEITSQDKKSLETNEYTSFLLAAIKAQQKEIEELKKEVEALKAK